MNKKLKLGLFGFGCVGQGLYGVLHKTQGVKAEIKKICIKQRNKIRPIPDEFFTYDAKEILTDPDIDIVVELIDDASAAFEIIKAALASGKAVVTANKKMLAENLQEIYELQLRYGKPVLYEGSVCGSIPIIRNLEEYYDNDLISSIEGIFNGSTNYILTKVIEEQKSYDVALRQAQELGFAESDPTLDVKGFDPKYKLVIAIAHTFGVFVKPENVINIGIDRISATDLAFAQKNDYAIKLIARAFRIDNEVFGFVAPQFISKSSPLATVRNEYNAVQVQGAFAETQLFIGKGAGGYPTGSAVLSDISALTYSYSYEYKKHAQAQNIQFSNDLFIDVFVSFDESVNIDIKDFETFDSGFASQGRHYMKGVVSLEKLRRWSSLAGVSILLSPDTRFISAKSTIKNEQLSVA